MRMVKGKHSTSLSVFLSIILCVCGQAKAEISLKAVLTEVHGDVKVQKKGETGWKSAEAQIIIETGDRIKTEAGGDCVLRWSNGHVARVSPMSLIEVETLERDPATGQENNVFSVQKGKLIAKTSGKLKNKNSRFSIKTPTAVAGVRGTTFSCSVNEQLTTCACYEGKVYVVSTSTDKGVTLDPGYMTTVAPNQSPTSPESLSEDQLKDRDEIDKSTGPSLHLLRPPDESDVEGQQIEIEGITDPGGKILVNGKEYYGDARTGRFLFSVPLNEGKNEFIITAVDKHGRERTHKRKVNCKFKRGGSIQIVLTSPNDGYVTKEEAVTITGNVSEGAKVKLSEGSGSETPISVSNGKFVHRARLVEGANVFTFTGYKSGSSKMEAVSITIYKDTKAPSIELIQPASGVFSVDGRVCLSGVSDISCTIIGKTEPGVMFTINSRQCVVDSSGMFRCNITMPLESTSILLQASDAAGNMTSRNITRYIDINKAERLTVSVTPSSIVANGYDTATVSVTAMNFFGQPVNVSVSLSASTPPGCGALSASSVVTVNGTGSVTYRAGSGDVMPVPVTVTASSGGITTSTTLTLMPNVPPPHRVGK